MYGHRASSTGETLGATSCEESCRSKKYARKCQTLTRTTSSTALSTPSERKGVCQSKCVRVGPSLPCRTSHIGRKHLYISQGGAWHDLFDGRISFVNRRGLDSWQGKEHGVWSGVEWSGVIRETTGIGRIRVSCTLKLLQGRFVFFRWFGGSSHLVCPHEPLFLFGSASVSHIYSGLSYTSLTCRV